MACGRDSERASIGDSAVDIAGNVQRIQQRGELFPGELAAQQANNQHVLAGTRQILQNVGQSAQLHPLHMQQLQELVNFTPQMNEMRLQAQQLENQYGPNSPATAEIRNRMQQLQLQTGIEVFRNLPERLQTQDALHALTLSHNRTMNPLIESSARNRVASQEAQSEFDSQPLSSRLHVAYHPDSQREANAAVDAIARNEGLDPAQLPANVRQGLVDEHLHRNGAGTVMLQTGPGTYSAMGNRAPGAPVWTPQLQQHAQDHAETAVRHELTDYQNRLRGHGNTRPDPNATPPAWFGPALTPDLLRHPDAGVQSTNAHVIEVARAAEVRRRVAMARDEAGSLRTRPTTATPEGVQPSGPGLEGQGGNAAPAPGGGGLQDAARDLGVRNFVPPVQRQPRFDNIRAANQEQRSVLGGLAPDLQSEANVARATVERLTTRLETMIQEHGEPSSMTAAQRRAYNSTLRDIHRAMRTNWPLPSGMGSMHPAVANHLLPE